MPSLLYSAQCDLSPPLICHSKLIYADFLHQFGWRPTVCHKILYKVRKSVWQQWMCGKFAILINHYIQTSPYNMIISLKMMVSGYYCLFMILKQLPFEFQATIHIKVGFNEPKKGSWAIWNPVKLRKKCMLIEVS